MLARGDVGFPVNIAGPNDVVRVKRSRNRECASTPLARRLQKKHFQSRLPVVAISAQISEVPHLWLAQRAIAVGVNGAI